MRNASNNRLNAFDVHTGNNGTVVFGKNARNRLTIASVETGDIAEVRALSAQFGAIAIVPHTGEVVTMNHLSDEQLSFVRQAFGIQEISATMRAKMAQAHLN